MSCASVETITRVLRASLLAAVLPVLAAAQPAASGGPETVTVRLSSFNYAPERLRLRSGAPVRLRLVNEGDGGHDFSAPPLFASSAYPPPGGSPAPEGRIEVPGHSTREIVLAPTRPGSYAVECTHFLHALFGMTATVEVVPPG